MTEVASKLKSLGYRPQNEGAAISVDRLELEQQVGYSLPDDYWEFLATFPLTGGFDQEIAFSGIEKSPWASEGLEFLDTLYGQCPDPMNELLPLRRLYAQVHQMPLHLLVIGMVMGSNLVCLDLRKESYGRVFVWDHEHDTEDPRAGLYLAAASFVEFVAQLHVAKSVLRPDLPEGVRVHTTEWMETRVAEWKKKQQLLKQRK